MKKLIALMALFAIALSSCNKAEEEMENDSNVEAIISETEVVAEEADTEEATTTEEESNEAEQAVAEIEAEAEAVVSE